jgi:hypothetical protein
MLIDAPSVEETDTKHKDTQVRLTEDNANEVLNMINRINR